MTISSTLLLVRHGERADSPELHHPWKNNRGLRPEDCPLTDLGRRQAAAVGWSLASEALPCTVVYTSPMRRCLETASEIAHPMKLPVAVIVPLAKSCSYVRRCASRGQTPVFANALEAEEILKTIQPTVSLQEYHGDDGLDCVTTLERLVSESITANESKQPVTLIVGHCESQREIASMSGLRRRIATPYCGRATFLLEHNEETGAFWRLMQAPEEGRLQAPSISSTYT